MHLVECCNAYFPGERADVLLGSPHHVGRPVSDRHSQRGLCWRMGGLALQACLADLAVAQAMQLGLQCSQALLNA